MRSILCTLLALAGTIHFAYGQFRLSIQGNGLFSSAASTNVDLKNTDDNTNALLRFGDSNLSKASIGWNGNDDAFKISMATTNN